ncbi:MAG: CCXG family PEP-CTERM protein [Gammaproteobacteria bacterium]|nr:CCXG family PEP-CTERM protein [Gammaproteobacteria bacterium]
MNRPILRTTLRLILALLIAAPHAALAWWNCSWSSRVPVQIAAPASAQSSYTLEIMLTAAQLPGYNWAQLDADLRVIDQDDQTPLTFFVQPRAAGTQVVRLWVLFPSLAAAPRTIYVYYGNTAATSVSSGAGTLAGAAAGLRLWTRYYAGPVFANEAAWYASWNASNDQTAGYSCAVQSALNGQNNHSLFGAGTYIAWNDTTILYVSPVQAGTWSFRWGPDLGLGGGLFVDDQPLQQKFGTDLWWAGSWSNTSQILQGSITLAAGYHVLRGIGDENCCDGGQEIDAQAPGGAWTVLSSGSFATAAPSCQAALASPQSVQTQGTTGSCSATHFVITNSAWGIHCLAQTVTVTVVDGAGNPFTGYSGTMNLSTSTGLGTWTLVSGGGAFSDPVANDGAASYAWPAGQSSATFSLTYASGPSPVTVHAVDASNATLVDTGTQPAITFSPSGFTVTAAPLATPVSTVPPYPASATAGTNLPVDLTAYGQTPNNPVCGVITSYAGNKPLKFWTQAVNPASQSVVATVNGASVAAAEGAATAQTVAFTAGRAAVTFKYKDVGALALSVKDDSTGNPLLPNGIRGSTGTFVSRPANFLVTNVLRTRDGAANPGATTAGGSVFIGAGQAFSATVTAVDAEGSPTPSFGHETPPETLRFDASVLLPAGGDAPAVSGGFGGFVNGQASGQGFAWPEVGVLALVPRIADGDYLGSGDVVGSASGPVGRFVPDHFAVAANTPLFATACTAGGFTYTGQPFGYAVAPVLTVTALAAGGSTTLNYTGALLRVTNQSLGARSYAAATGTLDTSGLPPSSADPAIADLGGGRFTLTFSSGTGLAFVHGQPSAPFQADVALSIGVTDLDGVSASNPVTIGGSGGIGFSAGAAMLYGRLTIGNAVGSELLDLPVPLTVQEYLGTAQGFTTNVADSCSAAPAIALGNYQQALAAGETCVRDSGQPGVSGSGCAAPAAPASAYRASASGGTFNLILAAPGAGHSGAVTVTPSAPAWLQYPWNAASGTASNPAATAAFGLYQGPGARIYQREVY